MQSGTAHAVVTLLLRGRVLGRDCGCMGLHRACPMQLPYSVPEGHYGPGSDHPQSVAADIRRDEVEPPVRAVVARAPVSERRCPAGSGSPSSTPMQLHYSM